MQSFITVTGENKEVKMPNSDANSDVFDCFFAVNHVISMLTSRLIYTSFHLLSDFTSPAVFL